MTAYGSKDIKHSGNCKEKKACGFYFDPGYATAISENFYGVGPGKGAGPACGRCYELIARWDSSGNKLYNTKPIVVRVNDLCPATPGGHDVCSIWDGGTNTFGAVVNFDLCMDTGANWAVFAPYNIGMAVGWAIDISCSKWWGTQIGTGW